MAPGSAKLHGLRKAGSGPYPDFDVSVSPFPFPISHNSPITVDVPGPRTKADPGPEPTLDGHAPVEELAETISTAAKDLLAPITEALDGHTSDLESWCALHGLNPTGRETASVLARQAVFNIFSKATLYEWYYRQGNLPPLSYTPRSQFRQACVETGVDAFEESILDELAWLASDDAFDTVLANREALLDSSQPAEDLGAIYESIVVKEFRQPLGQFRTPPTIAELMRRWAVSTGDRLLDPGVGAGVLSSPFHPRWSIAPEPSHVSGIDRSPLSRLMATTALTLYRQPHEPRRSDFLDLSPNDLERPVDAVVSNPPYSNGDDLPKNYKNRINTRFEEKLQTDISVRSPLYAYFIFHSRSFLSPGDRCVFLTPLNFLTADYGTVLKQFLLDEFSIRAMVRFPIDDDSVFADAESTALGIFLEARDTEELRGSTRFIRVDEPVDGSDLQGIVDSNESGETAWGRVNTVQQAELLATQNWVSRFTPCPVDRERLPRLGDFVDVARGTSTGSVDVFCLSDDEVLKYGIPDQDVTRLIRRPSLVSGYDFCTADWEALRATGEEVWLLTPESLSGIPESIAQFDDKYGQEIGRDTSCDSGHASTIAYLREAVVDGNLRGIRALKDRPCWYQPRQQDSPEALVADADRDDFPFILNDTSARNINNFRGIYCDSLTETELKALLAYLNSPVGQQVIQTLTQPRQGGYKKLGVRDLENLPVIDVDALEGETVNTLADAFDELRETARRDQDCERVLDRIDAIVQPIV